MFEAYNYNMNIAVVVVEFACQVPANGAVIISAAVHPTNVEAGAAAVML